MKKTMILALMALLVLCLAGTAKALDGCFIINTDVDNKVNPGESFDVEVKVENNLSISVENINVEVVVKDIDDGDDLDDDSDIDDLDHGDDDSATFSFDVPYAVDEKAYKIEITVEGDATNGSTCTTVTNSSVKIEKEKHKIVMKQPAVDQDTLKCSRTAQVTTTLYNIGDKDEDIDMSVYNTALGINQKQSFSLDSGDNEDDIKATKTFSLDLKEADAGTYTFYVKAEYDDGGEQETASFQLKVEDCQTTKPTTPVVNQTPQQPVVTPVTPVTPQIPTTPNVVVPAIVEEPTFMEQYGAVLLLGLAYIVVIIVGVVLVVGLLRRRE